MAIRAESELTQLEDNAATTPYPCHTYTTW